jgi:hypothetical protein
METTDGFTNYFTIEALRKRISIIKSKRNGEAA